MTVGELISALERFDKNMSVTITDGYKVNVYQGNWSIMEYEGDDGTKTVDIGIGGTLIDNIHVE